MKLNRIDHIHIGYAVGILELAHQNIVAIPGGLRVEILTEIHTAAWSQVRLAEQVPILAVSSENEGTKNSHVDSMLT